MTFYISILLDDKTKFIYASSFFLKKIFFLLKATHHTLKLIIHYYTFTYFFSKKIDKWCVINFIQLQDDWQTISYR